MGRTFLVRRQMRASGLSFGSSAGTDPHCREGGKELFRQKKGKEGSHKRQEGRSEASATNKNISLVLNI